MMKMENKICLTRINKCESITRLDFIPSFIRHVIQSTNTSAQSTHRPSDHYTELLSKPGDTYLHFSSDLSDLRVFEVLPLTKASTLLTIIYYHSDKSMLWELKHCAVVV